MSEANRVKLLCGITLAAIAMSAAPTYAQDPLGTATPVYNGFGMHYPEGTAAAKYLYGTVGTFKSYNNITNIYQYYAGYTGGAFGNQQPTGVVAPALVGELIGFANGQHATSVPDANDHALFNLAKNATACASARCSSFEEHNGRGAGGAAVRTPFSQFWFDDNWLARNVSIAYGAPNPDGFFNPGDFNRWKILNLDNTNWTPYPNPSGFIDLLALNGLYEISVGNSSQALAYLNRALAVAGTKYDATMLRYNYPGVLSEYYLGLMKILADKLINMKGLDTATVDGLIQHSIALRSNILSDQQQESGRPIGWVTGDAATSRTSATSVINTETTSANILALGAEAVLSYEVGRAPLNSSHCVNCFLRPHNVFSAVVGLTPPSTVMSYGPYTTLPPGNYIVDFYLRTPNPSGNVAYVDVCNNLGKNIFISKVITAGDMLGGNQWTRISLPITVSAGNNTRMEFRLIWYGSGNLDASTIRVR
jgi:hypothetical protein